MAESDPLPILSPDRPNSSNERARAAKFVQVDARALASDLRARVAGEVRFDASSRALYATDGSNYRQIPVGVVVPRTAADVIAAIVTCQEHGAPILPRGGGTSLAGQCCNTAVVLDFTKYMAAILEVDPSRKIARVQPGVILDHLRNAAETHHLTFAPDPATHDRCTLGGMIGNNSCGVHSVMAGKTDDNIEALEITTYEGLRMKVGATSPEELNQIIQGGGRRGEIYAKLKSIADTYGHLVRERYPNIPRRVSGYNLNYLLPENGFHVARALVGSEGTCVSVLEATCRLVESPPERTLLVAAYPDIYQAADQVPEIMAHRPIGLEGIDDLLVEYTRRRGINPEGLALLPPGGGWLLVEFGGQTRAEAEAHATGLMNVLSRASVVPKMHVCNRGEAKHVWTVRESSLGVISHVPGEPLSWEGWEDSAVSPEKLGNYLRDLRRLMGRYGYHGTFYGHFGHACIHTRLNFDYQSEEGIARFREFMNEAADLVVGYGGSLSGEHGDGQARAELLPKMFGRELIQAFNEFKSAWDPDWKMNPGKVVEPYRMDENLRLGADYHPWEPRTHFKFSQDHGSLAHATLRCVGVGKCRRDQGGVMCPSFRVTREEEHSTRGRAHLLWEMTKGEVIRDGWRSEDVKKSLDLCLSCKGCRSDCPVSVDLATYKAEFLSHYHEGRLRPFNHYAFGNIDFWARLASTAPGLVNITTQLPFLSDMAKAVAGIPRQRTIPAFAPETFTSWFRRHKSRNPDGPLVVLWPDTFNNYFLPHTARAAVDVLERGGFNVVLPRGRNLCCGRPLYDFGMLVRAKHLLLQILHAMAEEIEAGIPIVGLEPSCVAVFRDELSNLFPNDERAQRLSRQTFLFSEFLENYKDVIPLPQLRRKAIVHGHCHHKSVLKMNAEESVLRRIGLDYQLPSPGCCGMAGSFGFEDDKYDVSIAIGELDLLPAVRQAPPDWLVIANGFSCREQIAQETDRHALHLAEVLQLAIYQGPSGPPGSYPEKQLVRQHEGEIRRSMQRAGLAIAGFAASGALLWHFAKRS